MTVENYNYRTSQTMLRNAFPGKGKWQIPIIPKFEAEPDVFSNLLLIGFDKTNVEDVKHLDRIVHFFLYDYRFERVWKSPDADIERLSRYRAVLSPDFSMYLEMASVMQLYNTFRNRWCGAYWASKGMRVIPTVNWGDEYTFDFCFEGIEKGSAVAVSTYLNFITKVNRINESSIITRIHEYCVFESFQKLGWLFLGKDVKPKKPTIKLNRKAFIGILREELGKTFNIQKKQLFQSMINIIAQADEKIDDHFNAAFGVYRFEYVWEGLIDYVFGEANKEDYFPHASWHIIKGSKHESSALEPDTIMLFNGKTYILDAKYYKYGVTGNPLHLPGTSSVQKQITYGDYVAEHSEDSSKIYNAFIMPFDCCGEAPYKFVSVGTVDWINYSPATEAYKYVLGILLDTSHIINTFAKHNMQEIEDLSKLIEASADNYISALYEA